MKGSPMAVIPTSGLLASERVDAGPLGRTDARTRILLTVAFALVAVSLSTFPALVSALAVSVLSLPLAGVRIRAIGKRLALLEGLLVAVLVTLPFTVAGETAISLAGLEASENGLRLSALIALKANAVVLSVTGLLGGMEPSRFGRGLRGLGAPPLLVQLLLFTVRYLDVLRQEYGRLRRAMAARGFRPRTRLHTFRTFGSLVGMLLVRALDRSERVLGAMKCRGFDGTFRTLEAPVYTNRDVLAGLVGGAVLALVVGLEFLNGAAA